MLSELKDKQLKYTHTQNTWTNSEYQQKYRNCKKETDSEAEEYNNWIKSSLTGSTKGCD